jgi:hypothetical protein
VIGQALGHQGAEGRFIVHKQQMGGLGDGIQGANILTQPASAASGHLIQLMGMKPATRATDTRQCKGKEQKTWTVRPSRS